MMIDRDRRRCVGACLLAVTVPATLVACVSQPQQRTYTEKVSSIMVSGDKKHIVFFGANHHYIFDMPPRLLEILESPWRDRLFGYLQQFRVLPDRTVDGVIFLQIDMEGDSSETIFAIRKLIPFRQHADGRERYATSEPIEIRGKRYNSAPEIQPGQSQRLNHPYAVELTEFPSGKEMQDYSNSPIKKMSDGALTILLLPLYPLLSGICFVCK